MINLYQQITYALVSYTIKEELEGKIEPQSQLERTLEELRVDVFHANSPQAKGRIERLFKTFQDRGAREMRLYTQKELA